MLRSLSVFAVVGVFLANVHVSNAQVQQKQAATKGHVAHPAHGPHGGELLEIGKDEFHAELVVDEVKKQMVIYLLEADAKSSLVIGEPHLMVNLVLAGKPMQIQLKAIPLEAEPKGSSSCFGAISKELFDALHSTKADPKLVARIRNKSYVTKIVHKHDHSGHNHAQKPAVVSSKRR